MGTRSLAMALGVAGLLCLAGCAETSSGSSLKSRVFSGALVETRTSEGQVRRLSVTDLASWRQWHHNPTKGDGDNIVVKAELTF